MPLDKTNTRRGTIGEGLPIARGVSERGRRSGRVPRPSRPCRGSLYRVRTAAAGGSAARPGRPWHEPGRWGCLTLFAPPSYKTLLPPPHRTDRLMPRTKSLPLTAAPSQQGADAARARRAPTPSSASAARRTPSIASGCSASWPRTATPSSPDADGADVVVVNTCGFIEPARQESLGVIREMLDLKKQGKVGAVVVAGCLAERQRELLLEQVPEVDQIVGVFGREEIAAVVDRAVAQQRPSSGRVFRPAPVRALEDTARLRITPRHFAYLKISEGCDRLCTLLRHPEDARQARHQADRGGRPRGPRTGRRRRPRTHHRRPGHAPTTAWTCTAASASPSCSASSTRSTASSGSALLYAYPEHFTDELLETLAGAEEGHPVPRHAAPAHQRPGAEADAAGAWTAGDDRGAARAGCGRRCPDLALRTTFIVGFPGETDAEFEELQQFVRRAQVRAGRRVPVLARTRHAGRRSSTATCRRT